MTVRFQTISDYYIQAIDEEIQKLSLSLRQGACKDFSDYKEIVGMCRGLELSKETFDRVLKEIEHGNTTNDGQQSVARPRTENPYI